VATGRSRTSARRFGVEAGPRGSSRPGLRCDWTSGTSKPAGIVTASGTLNLRAAAYEEPIQGDRTEVGDGYRATTGTWSLNIYTTKGQYKGLMGGDRGSGIEFVKERRLIFRFEGFVTKG